MKTMRIVFSTLFFLEEHEEWMVSCRTVQLRHEDCSSFFFWKNMKNIENQVAWFLAELCKKGVQKDKRNQRRTELH
jgi:hypothetical protein